MIKYYRVVGGPLDTNAYVVYSDTDNSGVIIDPGVPVDSLVRVVEKLGITRIHLIIATHGHFDHVFYAGALSKLYSTELLIHEIDSKLLNRNKFLAEYLYHDTLVLPDSFKFVRNDSILKLTEELEIKILHTPGHTKGSLCFLVGDLLITGDTLFKNTIGRTDFPESSAKDMEGSLIKLAKLPGDYVVLPGHGDLTTLELERKTNPYLKNVFKE